MKYNFDEIIKRENTNSIKYDLRKVLFGTDDVLPMWVADMDLKTPDFITNAIQNRTKHEIYGYSLRPDGFYESIINWVYKRHQWEVQKSWISSSPGIVTGMSLAIQALTNPGDKIIVQPPVYPPFFEVVTKNNRNLILNPLKLVNNRYSFDFEDISQKIKNNIKMLLLCSPQNPGGIVWRKEELLKLAELCIKNNVIIYSDEVHSDIVYPGYVHIPIASLSEEISNITITSISPSKTFNIAGFLSSVSIISNNQLNQTYKRQLEGLHLQNLNLFGNIALISAYNEGEEWLEQLLDYLNENKNFVMNFIRKRIPKIHFIEPEATYLIWLDFRDYKFSQHQLKELLIKKAKLGLNDGLTFGEGGEGFMRMNFACSRLILEDSLKRIETAFS